MRAAVAVTSRCASAAIPVCSRAPVSAIGSIRWKQSQTAKVGIHKPSTLKMHDITRRPLRRAPNLVPLVPADTPAIAEHKPVGATAPAEGAEARSFAAVAVGGRQHKVTEGDVLIVDRLPGLEVGQQAEWDQVLLVGSAAKTIVGRPLVPGAIVKVSVEQQTYAAKLPIFKKRRRKGYKRFNTFRRPITVLRVDEIECDLLQ